MALRDCFTVAVLVCSVSVVHTEQSQQSTLKKPMNACRPSALREFCRVGCPDPVPMMLTETHHVEPALKDVRRPLPSGVAILELGIDLEGTVVSACVAKGVRDDFDAAAQAAALQSRWNVPKPLKGTEAGFTIYMTACTPDRLSECKRRLNK